MRDYLEELLAGTEDALDQAEAEWTEGVSPPLPRRSKERPEAAGGPAEPERSAGAEETARDGKNWIETEREGQSRSGETGAVLESRERAEQPEGPAGLRTVLSSALPDLPAGLRTVLSDRPLEGDEASTLSWLLWAGRQGRAVPRERSLGRPEAGAGTVPDIRGEERASLWETEGVAGTRRLQAAMELARRAAGYRREPRADRAGPVSLRPGSDEPLLREHDSARTVDRIFRRDARRYDGGFALF